MTHFHCGSYRLPLYRPAIMGILNVTPDSFSDGGRYLTPQQAIDQGLRLIDAGADVLDIGGESTRPGSQPVCEVEELRRVLPVIEALATGPVPLSIDTRHPAVMQAALHAGVSLINDIQALQAPGALEICAASPAGVCLMHMQGNPATMQQQPVYSDVVHVVRDFLLQRAHAAQAAGIAQARILLDPGFGFGKTLAHNLALLRALPHLSALGYPLLVGLSRKSVLGVVTGQSVEDRLPASLTAALLALERGAWMVRVHDVAATRQALRLRQAVLDPA